MASPTAFRRQIADCDMKVAIKLSALWAQQQQQEVWFKFDILQLGFCRNRRRHHWPMNWRKSDNIKTKNPPN